MEVQTDADGRPLPIGGPALPEKAYSPGQVAGAAFLGGPLAGAILLASNFTLFRVGPDRPTTLALGVVGAFAVMGLAFVLPDATPDALLPAFYVLAMQQIAQRTHGERYKAWIARGGARHSNWRVTGIGFACLAVLFALLFVVIVSVPEEWIGVAA